jgi:two-component system OmpR family sensor kinase
MSFLSSLYGRVTLLTVAIGILLGAAAIFGMDMTARLYHQEANQRVHRDLASWLIQQYRFERNGQIDTAGIDAIFGDAMRINPSIEVYLLDVDGWVRAFNAPPGRVKLDRVNMTPVRQFLAGDTHLPIMGTDPRHPMGEQVFSVAPVSLNERVVGYVYVVVGGELYQTWETRLRSSQILKLAAIWACAVVFAGALAGFLSFRFLTGRIMRLANALERFSQSGFTLPPAALATIPGRLGADEIDRLQSRFVELGRVISRQVEQLRAADVQLRDAIAGVSHDLRTPLTALGGYLDTLLLRQELLSPAEQHRYLVLAAAQQQRLVRLVQSQFELALLESSANPFDPQRACLSDLINDVVQKLAPVAATAGLKLTFDMPQAAVYAYMDLGLIERVLENLIGNAIRHTSAGGTVMVSIQEESGRVVVTVADTGTGIDAAMKASLFARSFHGRDRPHSRGDRAGLGLVIAQRIVTLHGGSISVDSQPGQGARFRFDVPAGEQTLPTVS